MFNRSSAASRLDVSLVLGGETATQIPTPDGNPLYEIRFPNGRALQLAEVGSSRYLVQPGDGTDFKPFYFFRERYADEALVGFFRQARQLPKRIDGAEADLSALNLTPRGAATGASAVEGALTPPDLAQFVEAESTVYLMRTLHEVRTHLRQHVSAMARSAWPAVDAGLGRLEESIRGRYEREFGRQMRAYVRAGCDSETDGVDVRNTAIHFTSAAELGKMVIAAFVVPAVDHDGAPVKAAPLKCAAAHPLDRFIELQHGILSNYLAPGFNFRLAEELVLARARATSPAGPQQAMPEMKRLPHHH